MTPSPSTDLSENTPDLYCPQCEYNLHGINSARCPECGTSIDYEALARICTLARQSLCQVLLPDAKNRWQVYWGLCALAWFRPRRLAELMPYRHSTSVAHAFNLINKAIAGLIVAAFFNIFEFIAAGYFPWRETLSFIAIAFSCTFACEASIAFLLKVLVKPKGRPDAPRFHFWWGMQHILSAHVLISSVLGVIGFAILTHSPFFLDRFSFEYRDFIGVAIWFQFFAAPFLYWWIVLNRLISIRGVGQTTLAMIAIPIVVAGVVFATYLVVVFAILAWTGWL